MRVLCYMGRTFRWWRVRRSGVYAGRVRKWLALLIGVASTVLLSSCSSSKECSVGFGGNSVKCTDSNSLSDFFGSLNWGLIFVIAMGVIGILAKLADSAPSTPNAPKPTQVQASTLRPGDSIVGQDGPLLVQAVTWVSATEVQLTFTTGASQTVRESLVLTKLPTPLS